MRHKLLILTISLSLLSLFNNKVYADDASSSTSPSSNNVAEENQIQDLKLEVKLMHQQMLSMQTVLEKQKTTQAHLVAHREKHQTSQEAELTRISGVKVADNGAGAAALSSATQTKQSNAVQQAQNSNSGTSPPPGQGANLITVPNDSSGGTTNSIPAPASSSGSSSGNSSAGPLPVYTVATANYIGGIPVVISPYLGAPPAYDASDLIVNFVGVNTDLLLLQQRQNIETVYGNQNLTAPPNYLALSGQIQGQAQIGHPFTGPVSKALTLTTANLDTMAAVGNWCTGFISLNYDSTPPFSNIPVYAGPPPHNSRFFLDQGFITIGNLNTSDFYGTIGQIVVPFGTYSSSRLSGSLPGDLGQTTARAVDFGYNNSGDVFGLSAQAFSYLGQSVTSVNAQNTTEGGANIDITANKDPYSLDVGGSYISNIADSDVMQLNGTNLDVTTSSSGFGINFTTEQLAHRVAAWDAHGSLGVEKLTFTGEYVTAANAFDRMDMGIDDHPARPSAYDVEATYKFNIFCDKPSNFTLSMDQSHQALALYLPQKSYAATFSTSLLPDTVESLEYDRDINYPRGSLASSSFENITTSGLGDYSNTFIGEISIYF